MESSKTGQALQEYVRLYLKGVPDFKLRELSSGFVEDVSHFLKQHVLQNTALSSQDRAQSFAAMNDLLDDFERDLNRLLVDKVEEFLSSC